MSFRAIKEMPGSIADVAVANRLHRHRSAVKRDVDLQAKAGVVWVTRVPHPGHGQKKEARAIAEKRILRSELGSFVPRDWVSGFMRACAQAFVLMTLIRHRRVLMMSHADLPQMILKSSTMYP